jgi:micrococcal nuclease
MLTSLFAMLLASQSLNVSDEFPICGEGRRVTCVVDGDTFWHNRIKYRLADIDAPEVSKPQCAVEARQGRAATYRLAELLNAGSVELQTRGVDRYGRTLVTVMRAGRSIGGQLVSEGFARRWGDRRGWC